MKLSFVSAVAFFLTIVLFQNCSKTSFIFSSKEDPTIYSLDFESLNTFSISENEFYKVVLVIDSSNSMSDELLKMSNSVDQIIEAAKGYNIKFYVYNTDGSNTVSINNGIRFKNSESSAAEVSEFMDFTLTDGKIVTRKTADFALGDWTSAQYQIRLKPALAIFELKNDSSNEDFFRIKEELRQLITKTQPLNVQSDEYGICTLKRILAEEGPNRILFPGDKVNFILISDENNRMLSDVDGRCSVGGIVTRHLSDYQDKWCLADYAGSTAQRRIFNANDCNKLNNKNDILSQTTQMSISAVMLVKERRVTFSYRDIDTILSKSLERNVDYNYDLVSPIEGVCSTEELIKIKQLVLAATGSESNLLSCVASFHNNGISQSLSSFTVKLSSTDSVDHQKLIKSTFLTNHCNESGSFFDSETRQLYPSYRLAIADRLAKSGVKDINPDKLAFARCGQLLSIEHLGVGASNPLAFQGVRDTFTREYLFPTPIKAKADALLGNQNYMVSSYHHSVNLDKNLCTMDSQTASYGVEQEFMIQSLGGNGHQESICSEDYSSKLSEFAKKFTKDQSRTFIIQKFKQNSELTSVLINGQEILGQENAYSLSGNKITFGADFVRPGDRVEVFFRHPETISN